MQVEDLALMKVHQQIQDLGPTDLMISLFQATKYM